MAGLCEQPGPVRKEQEGEGRGIEVKVPWVPLIFAIADLASRRRHDQELNTDLSPAVRTYPLRVSSQTTPAPICEV